ncbi:MAG: PRC-barrel domain-containing protein [Xanthobacteraceae bacterium]|jgi:sporulation protein YlmC with PRC-barrel domain
MRSHYRIIGSAAVAAVLLGGAGGSAGDDTPRTRRATTGTAETVRAGGDIAATVLDQQDVQGILGRQVLSSAGQDMGRVIDIVVDRSGQVRAAVIDFGGFLGVGNRKVAIDWNALHFAPTGSKYDRITLNLTREQVSAAPEYKDGRPLVVLGAADSVPPSPY